MKYKVAIIVDWENVKHLIFHNKYLLTSDTPKFSYNQYTEKLPDFFLAFLDSNEEPYRIFFYVTEPFTASIKDPLNRNINFAETQETKTYIKFLNKLGIQKLIALRKGRLVFRGWNFVNGEYKPILTQKKVDILIGLDIAHLAYKKIVDRILLFSYDLDLQPALKVARIEGIQIILPVLKEFQNCPRKIINPELELHSDYKRIRSYHEICCNLLNKTK